MANTSTFKPEYCEMLVDHMRQGNSYSTFILKVGCTRKTLYNWEKDFPEWANAKEEGMQAAKSFLESRLMVKASGQKVEGIDPKLIDTTCLIFALKTRFHETYGDKTKHEVSGDGVKIELHYAKDNAS